MNELLEKFKALPEKDRIWLLSFLDQLQEHPEAVKDFPDALKTED